jgi:nitroimidazol reductase NimA-like FMN-containing flavoprotein (pyridoxamine 5'-phosphate oxidase superfamily)
MPGFPDEPAYPERSCAIGEESCQEVKDEIKKLMDSEPFAVLATQGEGQPYASLISFAASPDLKHLVFSTSRETRKYNLLLNSRPVALMVDNRARKPPAINQISAVTITGKSYLAEDFQKQKWASLLLKKHPYLKSFIGAPSTALVVVEVYRYFLVRRFQEVSEWNPNQD